MNRATQPLEPIGIDLSEDEPASGEQGVPGSRVGEVPNGLQVVAWASALIWLCLYLADLRLLWDRPFHLLAAPVLAVLAWPCFAGLQRRVAGLGLVLLVLWLYQGVISLSFQWRNLAEIALGVYFFSLSPFRTSWGPRWLAFGLGMFFAASFLLFLATVYVPAVRDWRSVLYLTSEKTLASLENGALTEEAMTVQQGGFTPYLHLFGYQISAGLALVFALATLRGGRASWLWFGPTALAVMTLFLAGQRSAFLGFLIAFAGVILLRRRLWTGLLLTAGLGVLVAIVIYASEGVGDLREYNVVDRVQAGDSDFTSRLALQWWALRESLVHPFGLIGADLDYFEIAPDLLGPRIVAPHNGYLTRLLLFGWPVGLLTAFMFWLILRMGRASWRRYDESPDARLEMTLFLTLVSVMANALFHNASFATFNPETLVTLYLYTVCYSRRAAAETIAPHDDEFPAEPGGPARWLPRLALRGNRPGPRSA